MDVARADELVLKRSRLPDNDEPETHKKLKEIQEVASDLLDSGFEDENNQEEEEAEREYDDEVENNDEEDCEEPPTCDTCHSIADDLVNCEECGDSVCDPCLRSGLCQKCEERQETCVSCDLEDKWVCMRHCEECDVWTCEQCGCPCET